MNAAIVGTLVRSTLVALGSALFVQKGYLTEAALNEIVGAAVVIVTAVWGIVNAKRNSQ